MSLDLDTLEFLRQHHPAWRLLGSPHAALVASFLHRTFVEPNKRTITQADLAEALEDDLFALRERLGDETFPRTALEYLNDWAGDDKGWLRKFYRQGSDEPCFDLTPATEKAIGWLGTLSERSFVGTESRLLTLFELLRQIASGSETDPEARLAALQKRRDEIDDEIARVREGDMPMLDDSALRDRFQQFVTVARELLGDFREVEQNFRILDRGVRERIALWEGGKGELLEDIMSERDVIIDSDQGRSFRAFWDFLMSSERQDEFGELLDRVLSLPAVTELNPDARTRRVHYDWLEAGEHTQRTVARLSQQLRRFLDDAAWLENRRIMNILRGIEGKALVVRESLPGGNFYAIAESRASVELPMERPLYSPGLRPHLVDLAPVADGGDVDAAALFSETVVDKDALARHVRRALQGASRVTLGELCERWPLQQGLAELVTYLALADDRFDSTVDEAVEDVIVWRGQDRDGIERMKQARLPRVVFMR
ncbi:MAG: DUF3375 domain-containing protein [Gammaproteobacteria bacterium]|nr:DUF3375 domain-containing protein [Gammaproteobacteria bacterium]